MDEDSEGSGDEQPVPKKTVDKPPLPPLPSEVPQPPPLPPMPDQVIVREDYNPKGVQLSLWRCLIINFVNMNI